MIYSCCDVLDSSTPSETDTQELAASLQIQLLLFLGNSSGSAGGNPGGVTEGSNDDDDDDDEDDEDGNQRNLNLGEV